VDSSVFNDFLKSAKDVEERTASGKLFQTKVVAAEKHLPPMVARQVREITRTTKNEVVDVFGHQRLATVVSTGTRVLNCEGSGR